MELVRWNVAWMMMADTLLLILRRYLNYLGHRMHFSSKRHDLMTYTINIPPSQCLFQWVDLLSDQGGQVGLWIGLSLLSLFELVLLSWDLIKLVCCSCLKTEKPNPTKDGKSDVGML